MITTITRHLQGAVVSALVLTVLLAPMAHAAEILEQGPNYHIIAYEAGFDPTTEQIAGWVALRVDAPVVISNQGKLLVTIHSISTSPGWTYTIKKSGGYNSSVEVDFQNTEGCSARFKALYKPGKTVIDGGRLVCG